VIPEPAAQPRPPTDRWKEWDDFLEATPDAGFMQASWWADFRVTTGFEHFGAILRDGREIVGGAMVQRLSYDDESCFYYIQDGPVTPADESIGGEVYEAVLEAIEAHRVTETRTVSHLRIEPRWRRLPEFASGLLTPARDRYVEPRKSLWIDLRPPEEEILGRMKPKGRYNIRVAQRHGVVVVEDTSERGVADFIGLYEETSYRQGFGAKPPCYFRPLVGLLSSLGRGALFFAEHRGRRLAGALVVYFGRRATYFYGGSSVAERQVMAPYLLHFEIMRRCKSMGHEWYDLWGVAPENQPDHPWQSISGFKRKLGGVDIDLVPTLDYVYDAGAYERYLPSQHELVESPEAIPPASADRP